MEFLTGILYLSTLFSNALSYKTIMRFWPVILIGLGCEILISNMKESELKYDKGAVVIIICMGIFAAAMAVLSAMLDNCGIVYF